MSNMFPSSTFISIYYVILKSLLVGATSILRNSNSFTDTSIWLNNHVPCDNEKVVFPFDNSGLLLLPPKVEVAGFILPTKGALLLSLDGIIALNGNEKIDKNCRENKRKELRAQLLPPKIYKWFDPRTWLKTSLAGFPMNKAIPILDLLPCNNETVLIPSNGFFSFDMQKVHSIGLGHLNFADSSLSKDYFQKLLANSELGAAIFRNQADGVIVEYYRKDVCGCLRNFNEYLEPTCRDLIIECPKALCEVPIQPLGSCCPICGASLRFQMDSCNLKRKQILQNYLQSLVNQEIYHDLDLHVDYFHSDKLGIFLQANIIDRNEYEGKSIHFLKTLNETTDWEKLLNIEKKSEQLNIEFYLSGKSHSSITGLHVFLIIISLFIGSGLILVMYYHFSGSEYSHRDLVEQWLHTLQENFQYYCRQVTAPTNYAFARFDNGRESIQTNFRETSTVVASSSFFTRKNQSSSVQPIAANKRSFNNPMFSLQTPQITIEDEEKSQQEQECENDSIPTTIAAPEDKQEMVEINLKKLSLDNIEFDASESKLS